MRHFIRLLITVAVLLAIHSLTVHAVYPAAVQTITIDTPAPNTLVGSPVVITGSTTVYPNTGRLAYRVMSQTGEELGTGPVTVVTAPGQPGRFNATVSFNLPTTTGGIRLELFDLAPNGDALGYAGVNLRVAEYSNEQSIVIETPRPNTPSTGTVTVSGRTTRYPNQGQLGYGLIGEGEADLGGGTIPVQGSPGGPGRFNTPVTFTPPAQGGPVRIVVFERDPETGAYVGYSAVDVNTPRPIPAMTIQIDTPRVGTVVGTPVVVTGRTSRLPSRGFLSARVTDQAGAELGVGVVVVSETTTGAGVFRVPLTFNLPPGGTPVRIDIMDRDAAGNIIARDDVDVLVTPPPTVGPPPTPIGPIIRFDTPAPGTVVGSPVTITGGTTRYPTNGVLHYRFYNAAGGQLGGGTFGVTRTAEGSQFNVSLTFDLPAGGGGVRLELYDLDPVGNVLALAALNLTTSAAEAAQLITIDAPPAGTYVGSPIGIAGRTTRTPRNGQLSYRVLDAAGAVLGFGAFPVTGSADGPATFTASLTFSLPAGGGYIRLELSDLNTANQPYAQTSLDLQVAPSSVALLMQGSWRLSALGSRTAPTPAAEGTSLSLIFLSDGTLRGAGECLTIRGQYHADGDSLRFSGLNASSRACDRADLEAQQNAVFTALQSASRFTLQGDTLTILYDDERQALRFNRD